jgi:hypothetical protein
MNWLKKGKSNNKPPKVSLIIKSKQQTSGTLTECIRLDLVDLACFEQMYLTITKNTIVSPCYFVTCFSFKLCSTAAAKPSNCNKTEEIKCIIFSHEVISSAVLPVCLHHHPIKKDTKIQSKIPGNDEL